MNTDALIATLEHWHPRLAAVGEQEADVVVGSQWNRKELLGHLLDSALNNYQRFIRLQDGDLQDFPGYRQEHWVRAGAYRQGEWSRLVNLWYLFNQQLAQVVRNIPAGAERHRWVDKDVDLAFLVQDYLDHMLHHLRNMKL